MWAKAAREIIALFEKPLSRAELYPLLTAQGLVIEGANPDMVLSTMLWRSQDLIVRLPKFGYWIKSLPFEEANYEPATYNEADALLDEEPTSVERLIDESVEDRWEPPNFSESLM